MDAAQIRRGQERTSVGRKLDAANDAIGSGQLDVVMTIAAIELAQIPNVQFAHGIAGGQVRGRHIHVQSGVPVR